MEKQEGEKVGNRNSEFGMRKWEKRQMVRRWEGGKARRWEVEKVGRWEEFGSGNAEKGREISNSEAGKVRR